MVAKKIIHRNCILCNQPVSQELKCTAVYCGWICKRRAQKRRKTLRYHLKAIPRALKREIIAAFGGKCAKCGAEDRLQIDHRIPQYKGGKHDISNYQPLCFTCHRQKSDGEQRDFFRHNKTFWGFRTPYVPPLKRREEKRNIRLTEDDVRLIRSLYHKGKRGYGLVALAKRFNVSHPNIRIIIRGETWRDVQ